MSIHLGGAGKLAGLATATAAAYAAFLLASTPQHSHAATAPAHADASALPSLTALSDAFSSVAERIKPSVVYITSKRPGDVEAIGLEVPPEFRRFFNLPDAPPSGRSRRGPVMTASGSGFIVSADGYILTNHHVVDGATQVKVRLLDRREFDAKVIGSDPTTDVAVVKIDAHGLSPAPLGSSDSARVGQWVLAIGNPFGENLTFTVTEGIVSAKGRALDLPNRSSRSIQDFIQTDAAINPGNSGGPLVNTEGEVIGINSAIASETGTYNGYGFAVPIDLARQVMNQLIKTGRVERVALGILARDATAEDAAYAGLDRIEGVLVQDFSPSSPARAAGMEAGDLIVAIDDQPVPYLAQLQERIAFKHPGDKVAVQVVRKGGKRVILDVRLAKAPSEVAERPAPGAEPNDGDQADVPGLGASFEPMTEDVVAELDLPEAVRGVIVTRVDADGPSAERLAPPSQGPDVVRSVEGKAVRSVADIRSAVAAAHGGDIVSLDVWNARSRAGRVVRIRLDPAK